MYYNDWAGNSTSIGASESDICGYGLVLTTTKD